jgi:Flp pilus assembly protein TadD
MGRARIRSSKPSASQNPQPTVQALLAKAQSLITQCDFPLALSFVQRILQNDPDNVKAREMKGILEIEFGELDKAREVSVSVS